MNFYETATLLEALKQVKEPTNFLANRYFPTDENKDIFKSEKVLVEYRDGDQTVAPFISPRVNGVTLERLGNETHELIPPTAGLKRTLTVDDLRKRGFGEALYGDKTPEEREGILVTEDMRELRDALRRRHEVMASELLINNKVTIKEYGDDGKIAAEKEMKFYEGGSNPAAYTPSASWSTTEESGKQIIADITAMVKMLTTRGLSATEVVMASDVADVFLANTYIQKLLDNRRMEMGEVKPIELPDNAARIATLKIRGRMIDFLTYDEEYLDRESGEMKQYIPSGYVVVLAPKCGHTVYGGITQMEDDDEFHTYAGKEVPKLLVDRTHDTKMISVRSAPLLLPHFKAPWVSAKAITD